MSGRPSDWDVLDLVGDPVPGDPTIIRSVADRWSRIAQDAETAGTAIASLLGDQAVMTWIGEGATAFRSHSSKLPVQLGKCTDSYSAAARALGSWAGQLDGHQSTADRALAIGRIARSDLLNAQRSVGVTADAARAAHRTAFDTAAAQVAASSHDTSAADAAARRAAAADDAVSSAQHAASDAQARLDAAKRLALQTASLRDEDGRTTSRQLHAAADAGIHPDSFWHKLGDSLAKAWHVLVEVAKIVVLIGGIIAIFVAGPLALIVLAAALIILADTAAKYVKGQASILDVGLAALGCIPGEGVLSEAATATRAAEEAGTAVRLTQEATAVRTGAEETSTAVRAFKDVEEGAEIAAPAEGMKVYRVYGPAKNADGTALMGTAKDGSTFPLGSRPYGQSWTPKDPRLSSNFRSDAGLPNENPGTHFIEGILKDPSAVKEVRPALRLDDNPGGWPEYMIPGSEHAVEVTSVGGVNEPWTTPPGGWTLPFQAH